MQIARCHFSAGAEVRPAYRIAKCFIRAMLSEGKTVNEIKGIARVNFHPGKVEERKRLSAEAMEIVRTRDSGKSEQRCRVALSLRQKVPIASQSPPSAR